MLGPLRVATDGGSVLVLPPKQRVLLAVLLLRAGRVAPMDTLTEALWDDAPPRSARVTVQGYVHRLRQSLEDAAGERVVTSGPGYLIAVAAGELDLERFGSLRERARSAAAAGDWGAAAEQLNKALGLWRGDPLADVPSRLLQDTELPRLAELRTQAVQSRVDAELRLGRHADLVGELRQLASSEPLREAFHGQLMLALYRCGRQAEALEVFRDIGRRLRHELGISPGLELQQLHQRILGADPALIVAGRPRAQAAVADPGPDAVESAPAQLPRAVADFTGRKEQVKLLSDLLAAAPDIDHPGAVVITAVAGMGGVGKTALAVHVAHQLRARFPDGQLFASMQGATDPLSPAAVLASFLRDLGVPEAAIPADEVERASRYRTLLADRRMLIVLDDARDAAQVLPLLPGTASCAAVVTSRSTLLDLPGAVLVDLHVFDEGEAHQLLRRIAGVERITAEQAASAAVLASCAGLPLAIRIAGSRLASRPSWSVAHLAAKLAGESARLAELTAGELAVRACFTVSYRALSVGRRPDGADHARLFRWLGLPAASELSLSAIAALAGRPSAEVAAVLEALTDTHLLESLAPDRFRLHDLLRSYAAEMAARVDGAEERSDALRRFLGWYGEQAVIASAVLAPARKFPAVVAVQGVAAAFVTRSADAFDWFKREAVNLVASVEQAADLGFDLIAVQIATAMWTYFLRTPCTSDWLGVNRVGLASARKLGDDDVLSTLLTSLGQQYGRQGLFAESGRCLTEALTIRQRTGDSTGIASVLNALAHDLFYQERFEDALGYLRSALDIYVDLDEQSRAGVVLNNLGHALLRIKRPGEALEPLRRALAIQHQANDHYQIAVTRTSLGETCLDLGHFEEAVEHYQRARAAIRDTGEASIVHADVLHGLGYAMAAVGRVEEARAAWEAALPVLDAHHDPRAADLRRNLGN